jgi:hypothetical protein
MFTCAILFGSKRNNAKIKQKLFRFEAKQLLFEKNFNEHFHLVLTMTQKIIGEAKRSETNGSETKRKNWFLDFA